MFERNGEQLFLLIIVADSCHSTGELCEGMEKGIHCCSKIITLHGNCKSKGRFIWGLFVLVFPRWKDAIISFYLVIHGEGNGRPRGAVGNRRRRSDRKTKIAPPPFAKDKFLAM